MIASKQSLGRVGSKLSVSLIQVVEGPKRAEPGEASSPGTETLGQLLPSVRVPTFLPSHSLFYPQPSALTAVWAPLRLGLASMFNLLVQPRIWLTADIMVENSAWEDPFHLGSWANTFTNLKLTFLLLFYLL